MSTATQSVLITSSYLRVRARADNNVSTDFLNGQFLSLARGISSPHAEEVEEEDICGSQKEDIPRMEIFVSIRIKWGREFSGSTEGSIL
jgi:hypothetical protein